MASAKAIKIKIILSALVIIPLLSCLPVHIFFSIAAAGTYDVNNDPNRDKQIQKEAGKKILGKPTNMKPIKTNPSMYRSKIASKKAPFVVTIFFALATAPSTKSNPAAMVKNIIAKIILP